jgi:hypothetical protein
MRDRRPFSPSAALSKTSRGGRRIQGSSRHRGRLGWSLTAPRAALASAPHGRAAFAQCGQQRAGIGRCSGFHSWAARLVCFWVLLISVVCLQQLSYAEGSPVYLPRVGPPPLRFQLPPSPDRRAELPPLLMRDPAPPVPEPLPEPALVPPEPIPDAPSPAPPPPDISPGIDSPVPVPVPELNTTNQAVASDSLVTGQNETLKPQFLLRFFNRGTNGSTTVLAPFGFTPPAPGPAPSSRGNYSTGP